MDKIGYVYILATRKNGPLYAGVTSELGERIDLHETDRGRRSFTSRYNVKTLVYYEAHDSIEAAIAREKRLKKWPRAWKVALIEEDNPEWEGLEPPI